MKEANAEGRRKRATEERRGGGEESRYEGRGERQEMEMKMGLMAVD